MLFSLSFLPPSQMTFYYTHYSSVFFYIEEHIGDARDAGFNPRVRKIPWRRKWQPTPVFLPGESHGQRSLAGYSPWGPKEIQLSIHTYHTIDRTTFFVTAVSYSTDLPQVLTDGHLVCFPFPASTAALKILF